MSVYHLCDSICAWISCHQSLFSCVSGKYWRHKNVSHRCDWSSGFVRNLRYNLSTCVCISQTSAVVMTPRPGTSPPLYSPFHSFVCGIEHRFWFIKSAIFFALLLLKCDYIGLQVCPHIRIWAEFPMRQQKKGHKSLTFLWSITWWLE